MATQEQSLFLPFAFPLQTMTPIDDSIKISVASSMAQLEALCDRPLLDEDRKLVDVLLSTTEEQESLPFISTATTRGRVYFTFVEDTDGLPTQSA